MLTVRLLVATTFIGAAFAAAPSFARRIPPLHPTVALEAPFTVEEFLRPYTSLPFLREPIEQSLTREDLPRLYAELENNSPAARWDRALLGICVLEDGPAALEALKQFVSRPWDWREHGGTVSEAVHTLNRRMSSIQNAAMVDPSQSGPLLVSLLERDAAIDLLKDWQTLPFPLDMRSFEALIVNKFREWVARALLHTRSPELFLAVEDTYSALEATPESQAHDGDRQLMFNLTLLIGEHEIYLEKGWEGGADYLAGVDAAARFGGYAGYGVREDAFKRYYYRAHPWKSLCHNYGWPGFWSTMVLLFLAALTAGRRIYRRRVQRQAVSPEGPAGAE